MMKIHKRSRIAASPQARTESRARSERGQAMVEFGLGVPILLTLLVASTVFGVAFNNQLTLTQATTEGAQQLSISRGQTSDPCATVSTTVENAAPYLYKAATVNTVNGLQFSIAFGTTSGTTITYGSPYSGTSCTAAAASMISGDTAKVTVTYPCTLTIMGANIVNNCTLTGQTAELIQ